MAITVRFIGILRSASGKTKISMEIKGATSLREMIRKILKAKPKLEKMLIDPELEDTVANTLILVNGKEINVLDGLETMLKDGDEIVFVPVTHGG